MKTFDLASVGQFIRFPMNWVAKSCAFIFIWHAFRHFNSYPLLGSQSYFSNPRTEWVLLGILQLLAAILLFHKPKAWKLIVAALVHFGWCTAYPVGRHVGDSAFVFLLLGTAAVMLGGDRWIPLATLPSITGITLAALWKIHGGHFSVLDLTHCTIVRYPWMDWFDVFLTNHARISNILSNLVIIVELCAPFIWGLLFFPRLWLLRSVLVLFPICLLFSFGITGNLDEFPWVMLLAWLMMLGVRYDSPRLPGHLFLYPLAFIIVTASLFNINANIRKIYWNETDIVSELHFGLLPQDRLKQMALFIVAPYWNMYASPITEEQLFAADHTRLRRIQDAAELDCGCGTAVNRWERFYWERIGGALREASQQNTANILISRYQDLEGRPCATMVFPPPFPSLD